YHNRTGTLAPIAQAQSGTTWTFWDIGNAPGWTQSDLFGVSCPATNWCMAVGQERELEGNVTGMAERYNGTSWSNLLVGGSNATLRGVSCIETRFCMAVGAAGAFGFASTWDGTRFTSV